MANLNFTVDSALLRELGEKLVETVHLALVELVKNCYDADATKVEVEFSKIKRKTQIRISDNGRGMNFKAVQDYWMRIATSNKGNRGTSLIFGRPFTGAKGIGRFSCRRLGGSLKLITCGTEDGKSLGKQRLIQKTEVDFPWSSFAPGTDVTKIECEGSQSIIKNDFTGTTLIISDVAEEWTTQGFNWLKRQLAVLAANRGKKRKGFQEDLGFNVSLITPGFKGQVKDLRNELINAGWGTLKAYINKTSHAVCELTAQGIGTKKIQSSIKFPHLKDVSLEIGILVDTKSELRNSKILSLGTLKRILDEWGGVQVRYKGFRVYPYGDDDWLNIDYDRGLRKGKPQNELFSFAQSLKGVDAGRSLLNMLSMKSYVGSIEIGQSAEGFDMKANREGFLSSLAVEELKKFARFAIDWSTILRDFNMRRQLQLESEEAKVEFEQVIGQDIESNRVVDSAVNYIENEVKTISRSLPASERRIVEKSFFRATDAIKKYNESTQNELTHLRLIASTSTLLLIFSHEIKSTLGLLEESKNSLISLSKNINSKHQNELILISNDFIDLKNRLEELLELTSLVGADHRKTKPGQVSFKKKLIKVIRIFELICKKYEIQIDHSEVANNTTINNIIEAEVYSVILNILSNSIKSVIAGGGGRKIKISSSRVSGTNLISFKDSGIGLDSSKYDEVFIPFISDPEGKLYKNLQKRINPEDSIIVGNGSGLGLGIVKEIINAHNGTIKFKKPPYGWSAELEIKLP